MYRHHQQLLASDGLCTALHDAKQKVLADSKIGPLIEAQQASDQVTGSTSGTPAPSLSRGYQSTSRAVRTPGPQRDGWEAQSTTSLGSRGGVSGVSPRNSSSSVARPTPSTGRPTNTRLKTPGTLLQTSSGVRFDESTLSLDPNTSLHFNRTGVGMVQSFDQDTTLNVTFGVGTGLQGSGLAKFQAAEEATSDGLGTVIGRMGVLENTELGLLIVGKGLDIAVEELRRAPRVEFEAKGLSVVDVFFTDVCSPRFPRHFLFSLHYGIFSFVIITLLTHLLT